MIRLCFLLPLLFATVCPAATKPNVLLICVDDLKPLLGCYGDKLVKSPNIDRLAARGVLFEAAYCNQAVCSPSRNALMAGLRPQSLGIYDLGTNFRKSAPDAVTLTQHFMHNGYRAEGLGKIWHVGHGNTNDAASWSVPHYTPNAAGYLLKENNPPKSAPENAPSENQKESWKLPRGAPTESADVPDNKYGDGMIADEAIKRIEAAKQNPDEPLFLAVGFMKPHLPFVAPKKYWDLYDPAAFKLAELQTAPEGAPSFAPTTWGELRQYRDMPEVGPLTPDQQRHLIHGYHAATSYMDAQLGRVLDALDSGGLAQNTIIILWGDHGWHLGDHGMWCKHTNYEQAAHIPLIVAAPGVKPARTKALVETVDIYPTLSELAGLPDPAKIDGRSFAAVLKNPDAPARESVIHVYPRADKLGRAIRTDRYRMVEWKTIGAPADSAVMELYDYQADPAETKNLADEKPEVVAQLRAILATHPEAKPQIKSAPTKAAGTTKKKTVDRKALFTKRDANMDDKLSREEFLTGQPDPADAEKRFPKFDKNNDGFLTREEFGQ